MMTDNQTAMPGAGGEIKRIGPQLSEALSPALPFVLLFAIAGLNRVLNVDSALEAALVGLGVAALLLGAGALFVVRKPDHPPAPLFSSWHLPWGVAAVLGGAVLVRLGEPWTYWGVAVAVVGALDIVIGAVVLIRRGRPDPGS